PRWRNVKDPRDPSLQSLALDESLASICGAERQDELVVILAVEAYDVGSRVPGDERALRANIRETVDPLEFSVEGGEAKAA
ncbi:MAG TPA: hypothetical protein VI700_04160, partial [Thermoanaerobaculaceae bacterium]|nr:hypothetical protein [Thermoanaerobaculaceae bacterium]